ncbi:MAG TPA: hypothetical protein DD636_06595 [Anaerolineaceae bacterium]|nr:hypothetical protein [Anaerolineaceae bacterium]
MDLLERALQLKTDIPAIFLSLKSSETPWYAKLLAGLTLIYALSPIDLIPDFIPVLGYLDDLIVLPALIALTIHFIPRDIFEHYRQEAQGMWQDGKPKKWYFAIPFVLVWLFILWLIVKRFLLHP